MGEKIFPGDILDKSYMQVQHGILNQYLGLLMSAGKFLTSVSFFLYKMSLGERSGNLANFSLIGFSLVCEKTKISA